MQTTQTLVKARLAFEAEILAGTAQPRRGMVFRRVAGDANLPNHFTCRADVGEMGWADPEWLGPDRPRPALFKVAEQLRDKAWAFDGVDLAYTETPEDIATFGISSHADLGALAKRMADDASTINWQTKILSGSPEMLLREDGINMSGHIIGMFVAAHEEALKKSGAKNFIVVSFTSRAYPGERILLTIRRSTGMTVEDKYLEQGKGINALAELAREKAAAQFPCEADQGFAAGLHHALGLLGYDPAAPTNAQIVADLGMKSKADTEPESEPEQPDPATAHLHVDAKTREFVCDACETREKLPVPCRLNVVTDLLAAFTAKHLDCPAYAAATTGDST